MTLPHDGGTVKPATGRVTLLLIHRPKPPVAGLSRGRPGAIRGGAEMALRRPCTSLRGAGCWPPVIAVPKLLYRTIDPEADAKLVTDNQRDACVATFGDDARYQGDERYLAWLRDKVEEFPDGCLLAMLDDGRCVGQLELEVPFGRGVGYVNLFYVRPEFRGRGYGRKLCAHAEKYFRAWEARRIELHVSPTNERAVEFYRKMGYKFTRASEGGAALWLMCKRLE